MNTPTKARGYPTSLYDRQVAIVERVAEREGFNNRLRYWAPTVQFIIEDYARLTNLDADETPAAAQEAA